MLDELAARIVNLALHHAAATEASRLAHGTSRSSIPRRIPLTYNHEPTHVLLAAHLNTATTAQLSYTGIKADPRMLWPNFGPSDKFRD